MKLSELAASDRGREGKGICKPTDVAGAQNTKTIIQASLQENLGECTAADRACGSVDENCRQHLNLGHVLASRGRYEDALTALEECIALRPTHVEALVLKGRCLAATQSKAKVNSRFPLQRVLISFRHLTVYKSH